MHVSEIREGWKYWWECPEDESKSGVVTVDCISPDHEDFEDEKVLCTTSSGGSVEVSPVELSELEPGEWDEPDGL